jgi:hypothetical protein
VLVHNAVYLVGKHVGNGTRVNTYIIKSSKTGNKYARRLPKNKHGLVDFSKHVHPTIGKQRTKYSGNRAKDFLAANKKAQLSSTPACYTWHHLPGINKRTGEGYLVLVKTDIHKAVGHVGGMEEFLRFFKP